MSNENNIPAAESAKDPISQQAAFDSLPAVTTTESPSAPLSFWSRAITFAGLIVLGITPFAHAQLAAPNQPAFCPPLTSIATPTLFNLFWGTSPIRFPYQ